MKFWVGLDFFNVAIVALGQVLVGDPLAAFAIALSAIGLAGAAYETGRAA
jgi:hypothetical protein